MPDENAIPQEDPELADRIQRELAVELKIWAIRVVVSGDNIYLQGAVRSRQEYAHAMEVAHRLADRRAVIDQLTVEAQPMDAS